MPTTKNEEDNYAVCGETNMASMKGAVIHQPRGPEVLKLESLPIPEPASGQVLIRVKAFGLNLARKDCGSYTIFAMNVPPIPCSPRFDAFYVPVLPIAWLTACRIRWLDSGRPGGGREHARQSK